MGSSSFIEWLNSKEQTKWGTHLTLTSGLSLPVYWCLWHTSGPLSHMCTHTHTPTHIPNKQIFYMCPKGSAFSNCQVQYLGVSIKLHLPNILDSLDRLFCLLNLSVRAKNDKWYHCGYRFFNVSLYFCYFYSYVRRRWCVKESGPVSSRCSISVVVIEYPAISAWMPAAYY